MPVGSGDGARGSDAPDEEPWASDVNSPVVDRVFGENQFPEPLSAVLAYILCLVGEIG